VIWEIPERYLPASTAQQRKDGKDPSPHENGESPAQVALGGAPSSQDATAQP
jgi:hypothetical protein